MTVAVEHLDDVVLVWLDRPERRNALDHATLLELRDAQLVAEKSEARALVVAGRGSVFCAGADLTGVEGGEFVAALTAVLRGFGALAMPTIAAVHGAALGGGMQLALACDLRVAVPASRFGIPAARLGLVIDEWTIARMAREVGWSIARDMLVAASTYETDALHAAGFVHRVGDVDTAVAWAGELTRLAPLTMAAHKLTLERLAPALPADADVTAARERAWRSTDAEEGRRAFLEKRPPDFRGA
jgi:enoyl-CoA hydratase/carnithine racemase